MSLHGVREYKGLHRVPQAVGSFSLSALLSLYASPYPSASPSRAPLRGKEHRWDRSSLLGLQPAPACPPTSVPAVGWGLLPRASCCLRRTAGPGQIKPAQTWGLLQTFFLNQKSGTFTHSFHRAHGENRSHSRPFDQRDLNQGFGCKVTEEAGHPRD